MGYEGVLVGDAGDQTSGNADLQVEELVGKEVL